MARRLEDQRKEALDHARISLILFEQEPDGSTLGISAERLAWVIDRLQDAHAAQVKIERKAAKVA